jgi:hypothetical protein
VRKTWRGERRKFIIINNFTEEEEKRRRKEKEEDEGSEKVSNPIQCYEKSLHTTLNYGSKLLLCESEKENCAQKKRNFLFSIFTLCLPLLVNGDGGCGRIR